MSNYGRIPVAELDTEAFDNVEPGELPDPRFILRRDEGVATVCAWCSTKKEADAWCIARGLRINHTICPTCLKANT